MKRIVFLVFAAVSVLPAYASADDALDAKKAAAIAAAEEIINMRSSLAKALIKPDSEITEDTFKKVCGAVAKGVKEISEKEGFKIRHAAIRYRNPNADAKIDERMTLYGFEKDRELKEKWGTVEMEGNTYVSYMRPIFVEEACLACHGPKDKRPRFIIEKYPDDRAFDYSVGDLRGMIKIMFPAR